MNLALTVTNRHLIILIILGICLRLMIACQFQPVEYPDSRDYVTLARVIQTLNFQQATERTPIYAVVLLFAGFNYYLVWLLQGILGIVTSVATFSIIRKLTTNSNGAAFAGGLLATISLNQLLFETALLTETIATAMLSLIFLQIVKRNLFYTDNTANDSFLGLQASVLALLHPRYLIVCLSLAMMYLLPCTSSTSIKRQLRRLTIFWGSAAPLLLLWSFINFMSTGYFGLSLSGNTTFASHASGFVELAPSEYDDMKKIVISYREKLRQEYTDAAIPFAIVHAHKDLLPTCGNSELKLSNRLAQMSATLYANHPGKYLASVSKAWLDFWSTARIGHEGYFSKTMKNAHLLPILDKCWSIQDLFWSLVYLALFVTGILCAWQYLKEDKSLVVCYTLLVIFTVTMTSIVQAMLTLGDNARYALPFQPLMLTANISYLCTRLNLPTRL